MSYTEDYIADLENQNEELKDKLAASQLSFRSYKAISQLVIENSSVVWENEHSEDRVMLVKAVFRVTAADFLAAKDYPEAKEL